MIAHLNDDACRAIGEPGNICTLQTVKAMTVRGVKVSRHSRRVRGRGSCRGPGVTTSI
jgi:hypothetical protein